MKIIFVLHSHTSGGAERHLLQLMQGLSARRDIECVYAGPLDGWLGEKLVDAGFRCFHVPFHGRFDLISLVRLALLVRKEKADIVHGHLTRGALYAGLASLLSGTPNVATAHSTNAHKHFGRASRIIAVSDAVARFLADSGYPPEKIRTVYHGVQDYAGYAPSKDALRAEFDLGDAPVLAMVARFQSAKGHDIAFRALARLKNRPWMLLLAGGLETKWAEQMRSFAAQLGIESRIRFIGHRDDVANVYACTDIILAPSRREALSLTLLEAASFGLPVAAADVGGISEVVDNGETGLLVPPDDDAELAKAIQSLLDDSDLRIRMGKAARRCYEARFSVESMVDATFSVYEELANGRSAT